jgi:hypothetical protein
MAKKKRPLEVNVLAAQIVAGCCAKEKNGPEDKKGQFGYGDV